MKRNSLALFTLAGMLAASGPALAQDRLDRIVVRPTSGNEMTFECGNLFHPKPIDVEALLKINDRTQTQHLSNKLVGAMVREFVKWDYEFPNGEALESERTGPNGQVDGVVGPAMAHGRPHRLEPGRVRCRVVSDENNESTHEVVLHW